MAWILNKKTKILTECLNSDVINICKKDIEHYVVGDNASDLKKRIAVEGKSEGTDDGKKLEECTVSELKKLAEEKGIEGMSSLTKQELLKVLGE